MGTVARNTDIIAVSETSFDDAVKLGIERAARTLGKLTSASVVAHDVILSSGGRIAGYKVKMVVEFELDESGEGDLPMIDPATQTADFAAPTSGGRR